MSPNVRGMQVSEGGGHGVLVEFIHWKHYCNEVADLKMPTLDQANFYVGAATTFIALIVVLLGVVFGTDDPHPLFLALLIIGVLGAFVMTLYFKRAYDRAKEAFVQPARSIACRMWDIAEYHARLLEKSTGQTLDEMERPSWYSQV